MPPFFKKLVLLVKVCYNRIIGYYYEGGKTMFIQKNQTSSDKFFKTIVSEMEKLTACEIETLDTDLIEKDLTDFFERTELNPYAGDLRKITKAIENCGLEINRIHHEKFGPWNPIMTIISYQVDPWNEGVKTFKYVWR